MTLRLFLSIKAILSTGSGIAFVLIPAPLFSLYGVTVDASNIFNVQILGASLIGIGLICWFGKEMDRQAVSSVILALFIADGIGFVVLLMEQLSGRVNALGWTSVAIYLLLTLALGYFRFRQPDVALQA
jgi:hypothetical protein